MNKYKPLRQTDHETKKTLATQKFRPWKNFLPAPVIGVDEAGRGCLAGPVYAAAVILDPEKPHTKYVDSKTLSENDREDIYQEISQQHQVAVASASVMEIAQLNILWASMLAMKRAVEQLAKKYAYSQGHILVDGNRTIPKLPAEFQQTAMVKGDSLYRPIAAASICAKVVRDREMRRLDEKYPVYGFAKHKGYGTPFHRQAIQRHLPCPAHRQTFAGVKEYWSSDNQYPKSDATEQLPLV